MASYTCLAPWYRRIHLFLFLFGVTILPRCSHENTQFVTYIKMNLTCFTWLLFCFMSPRRYVWPSIRSTQQHLYFSSAKKIHRGKFIFFVFSSEWRYCHGVATKILTTCGPKIRAKSIDRNENNITIHFVPCIQVRTIVHLFAMTSVADLLFVSFLA